MKRYVRSSAASRDFKDILKSKIQEAVEEANFSIPDENAIEDSYLFSDTLELQLKNSWGRVVVPVSEIIGLDSDEIADVLVRAFNESVESGSTVLNKDAKEVIKMYKPYYDRMTDVISKVARKYDSDMSLDFNKVLKTAHIEADAILQFKNLYLLNRQLTMSYALGFEAVDASGPRSREWYNFVDDRSGATIQGPQGLFYNGDLVSLELDNFESGLDKLEIAVEDYFRNVEELIDSFETIRDNYASFEKDVKDFSNAFYDSYKSVYSDLSIEYYIENPLEGEDAYRGNGLKVELTVHCYRDRISFSLEFPYITWYSTDVTKKIVDAIMYRKKRYKIK